MNIADLNKKAEEIANWKPGQHIDRWGRTVANCYYGWKNCKYWHCHVCGRHIVDKSWGKHEPLACEVGEGCQKDWKP